METEKTVDRAKLSQAPSWVTLGFLAGALAMFSVYPDWFGKEPQETVANAPAAVTTVAVEGPTPTPTPVVPALIGRSSLEEAEAVFMLYRGDAIWDNDRSEFALWNRDAERFSEFFEVLRDDSGRLYFRTLTSLTRPVIEYQNEEGRPIRFTETMESREARLSNVPILFRTPPPKL